MKHRTRQAGFTLLEILVAMAIFGIIGALAMGGLNAVMRQESIAREQLERLHRLQRAVRIITGDFSQLSPRYVRDTLGGRAAPLLVPCDVQTVACLSHDGWRNPFGMFPRGTLQRAQYRLEDDKLIREYWPVMDRTLASKPRTDVLLDKVESFTLSFPGKDVQADWLTEWPPLGARTGGGSGEIPDAVQITLKLRDWGEIVRLVEIAH